MSRAEHPGSHSPGGPRHDDPETALHQQSRQAGRILQAVVLLIGGAIIYSIAAAAGLAALGFTAALLSTLASISIAMQNLNLPVLRRPTGTGFHGASWSKVTSVILTIIAIAADIVTVVLVINAH